MSQNELTAKIRELRDLRAMADELAAEIDQIQDEIKEHMSTAQTDTITGPDWKVTWKTVTSARLDSTRLKKELPLIAEQYTKESTCKRFTLT